VSVKHPARSSTSTTTTTASPTGGTANYGDERTPLCTVLQTTVAEPYGVVETPNINSRSGGIEKGNAGRECTKWNKELALKATTTKGVI
jgi:hypothetical protein